MCIQMYLALISHILFKTSDRRYSYVKERAVLLDGVAQIIDLAGVY